MLSPSVWYHSFAQEGGGKGCFLALSPFLVADEVFAGDVKVSVLLTVSWSKQWGQPQISNGDSRVGCKPYVSRAASLIRKVTSIGDIVRQSEIRISPISSSRKPEPEHVTRTRWERPPYPPYQ